MLAAGIAEVQTDLRKYLARVKKGEDVVITDHGKAVARLVAAKPLPESLEERLLPLVKAGIIRLPSRTRSKNPGHAPVLKGTPLSEIVIEDRR
jgi:prevent-host-death family protein